MKGGIVEKVALRVLPPLIGTLARLMFLTCKVKVSGEEYCNQTLDAGKPVVVSFWHYSFIGIFPRLCRYKGVLMVSSSRDGEYIARLAHTFGYSTVRGSRNKQGVQALKEMIRAVRNGQAAGIVADGSQGPARIAQPGALLVASMSGVPILPIVWSASRYWSIRSWDRTAFPKPFSRVEIAFGEPFEIPPRLKNEQLETYRMELERRLNDLYDEVWRAQGKSEH
jgi:lysophospholipid acyltransferase (LPLAT)-like uncharacterized protein